VVVLNGCASLFSALATVLCEAGGKRTPCLTPSVFARAVLGCDHGCLAGVLRVEARVSRMQGKPSTYRATPLVLGILNYDRFSGKCCVMGYFHAMLGSGSELPHSTCKQP
jgi:hypothetical protein